MHPEQSFSAKPFIFQKENEAKKKSITLLLLTELERAAVDWERIAICKEFQPALLKIASSQFLQGRRLGGSMVGTGWSKSWLSRLGKHLGNAGTPSPWESEMLMPGRNSWGSPAMPLREVWFGFLFQPKLNPAPLSLPFGHSRRMPSKGRCSHLSPGVEIGNKFHVLVLEGCGRESRRGAQPLVPFSLWIVSELGLPALRGCPRALGHLWGSQGHLWDPTPAVPRLLLPEPFSSACAMWVVTELGPTPTRSFNSAWW